MSSHRSLSRTGSRTRLRQEAAPQTSRSSLSRTPFTAPIFFSCSLLSRSPPCLSFLLWISWLSLALLHISVSSRASVMYHNITLTSSPLVWQCLSCLYHQLYIFISPVHHLAFSWYYSTPLLHRTDTRSLLMSYKCCTDASPSISSCWLPASSYRHRWIKELTVMR
ncbi:hypothetical protein BD626DRAFT_14377 [Schizophyllum amplum]|uniref:Uncharacterized protein n=1 Tax=Schizophyllum amplum TaxID=97359 RepID=A0A550CXP1_9AGAR|nr:hypothetical protein BD626DRAFT_14377 [Auriculariopsis ampla]